MIDRFHLREAEIQSVVNRLAERIRDDFPGGLDAVAILRGGMMLAADLVRRLHPHPVRLDVYPGTTMDLRGRPVLLIDDIIDSGETARSLIDWARERGAADVAICALLLRRGAPELPVRTYTGCTIESDEFVKGYGMDDGSGDRGRELPYVTGTGRRSERAPIR